MYQITSDKLRLIRALTGVSQRQFANLIGVDKRSVSAWEVGRSIANQDSVKKIVQFVGEDNYKQLDSLFYAMETQELTQRLQRKVVTRS
ncbi:helix-turn-helix domain-containing protein [Bacillus sp. FSL R9-9530]|uniref:helix-turn-helix domain-containing protein n=1 Tax=Bacillus sp. FSL R9-9530 TaxID=2921593 RepID=UPI00404703AB